MFVSALLRIPPYGPYVLGFELCLLKILQQTPGGESGFSARSASSLVALSTFNHAPQLNPLKQPAFPTSRKAGDRRQLRRFSFRIRAPKATRSLHIRTRISKRIAGFSDRWP